MMLDANIVATSPSTVYRVLKRADLLSKWNDTRSLGTPPPQPKSSNEKWHTDLMQLVIQGQVYYYQGIIDAYSRYIIAWDIHIEGTGLNTSLLLQEAFDKSPSDIHPDVIADNGPEFISREFREVINENGGKRIKITAYHPQSNGIDERFHRTLRTECTNGTNYENLIEAKKKVGKWIKQYNDERLHSAIDYMPPFVWHNNKQNDLKSLRKQKIILAKEKRKMENKTK
jgi:transposase InsO family protein